MHSVPRYLENHGERLKARYLAFIHELGEFQLEGKRIIDHLDLGGEFSYWWMTHLAEKSPYKSPGIYDCLRIMAVEEILIDRSSTELVLYSTSDILAQAIRALCKGRNILFIWPRGQLPEKRWNWRSIYSALSFPLRGILSIRWVARKWPLRRLQKPVWSDGPGTMFFCSYFVHLDPDLSRQGHFYSRQWELLPKHIHDRGMRTNWLQHFLFSQDVPDVQTGLRWMNAFNQNPTTQGSHAFLESYLTWRLVAKALRAWLWLNVKARKLRKFRHAFHPSGSNAWLWPFLRSDWLTSLVGPTAISNCLWVALFDAALKDMPKQRIGLYLFENQGWEMAFLHAWRKHGHGKIIGVQHATVPFWHLYYYEDVRTVTVASRCTKPLPDLFAVNGKMARDVFKGQGYRDDQLYDVEALRYMNLVDAAAKPSLGSLRATDAGSQMLNRHLRILLLGDIMEASMGRFCRLVEDCRRMLPFGYKLTLKPHPGMLLKHTDLPSKCDVTNEALDKIILNYDVVVATSSTSASIDAIFVGLPVIVVADGFGLNLSPLRNHSSTCFVTTPEELLQALIAAKTCGLDKFDGKDLFFVEKGLPRWTRMLNAG